MALPTAPFTRADAQRAFEAWGANCGPGAIAAIMGLTLDEVRPLMGDFERKRYTNPTLMWDTLGRIGRPWSRMRAPLTWPVHGLCRIQWHGPWMDEGVPIAARYRHTHWVAARSAPGAIAVFDINAISVGGWLPLKVWGDELVPWIIAEAVPRGNGAWTLTHVVEIAEAAEAVQPCMFGGAA